MPEVIGNGSIFSAQLSAAHLKQTLIRPACCVSIIISSNQFAHHPFCERLEHLKITGGELFRL